eukprot:Phypoly_transcript_01907.p1 GENE.Phypoly_transcript_01907~~Phypoly_transcript_01907.p1  ORF type:complete len:782 (+),score=154.01 Phypoly_transcript_01907:63-2348(+)
MADESDFHLVHDSEDEDTMRRTRSRSNNKKKRICWIGNPVYTEEDNKFYHAVKVDNTTYYLKEYVKFPVTTSTRRNPKRGARSGKDKVQDGYATIMVIGKIIRLWETKEEELMCQLNNLLVDPEDTPGGKRPFHGSKELFQKEDDNELCMSLKLLFPDANKTSVKMIVESFEDFSKRKHFPDNVYYVQSEKLLEPKIESGSSHKQYAEQGEGEDDEEDEERQQNKRSTKKGAERHEEEEEREDDEEDYSEELETSSKRTKKGNEQIIRSKRAKKIPHHKDAEEPAPQCPRTPPRAFDIELDSIATPSPSKRKNRRVISDDGDYVAIKKENSQLDDDGDDEVKPLRRLKRMKDLEEIVDTEPSLEDSPEVISTPRKRKRIITDSDAENAIFFEHREPVTRRSTRIPELQQRRHDKLRSIIAPEGSENKESENMDKGNSADDGTGGESTDYTNESTNNSSDGSDVAEIPSKNAIHSPKNSGKPLADETSDDARSSNANLQKKSVTPPKRKSDMSWIEISERGKMAVLVAKPSLQFAPPKSTDLPQRLKAPRNSTKAKQAKIKSFMTEKGNIAEVVNLVEDDEDSDSPTRIPHEKPKDVSKKRADNSDKPDKSRTSRKAKKRSHGSSFIPQLMFNDNDVDDDIQQHLKQQRLLHEFSRHSTTEKDEGKSGWGRWGMSKKCCMPNSLEEESEPEMRDNSEYDEDDDFLVADDAPIETYTPSQDDLDDGDDGDSPHEDEEFEDDNGTTMKNDQDGMLKHVFNNKQT